MGWLAVFAMGLVLGTLGGGGGILTVPILVGLFGMGAAEATGSSLLVVGTASSIGAVQGHIARRIDWQAGLLIAFPSTLGALAARAVLVPNIPDPVAGIAKDDLLLGTFAGIMVVIGIMMLRPISRQSQTESSRVKIALIGLLIGLISGVMGAGGGFLILPVLTLVLKVDLERAIPTSLLVISLQSIGGFVGELSNRIQWSLLGGIIAVAVFGLALGMAVRDRAPQKLLKVSFAILVFLVAVWMIVRVAN